MLKTKLTGERIKQHFAYSWWAYLLSLCLILFVWEMAYNITEYVPPADKTIQVTIVGDYVSESVLEYYEQKALEQFPEMEKITFDNIPLSFTGEESDYSGYTKLQVIIASGEGDVYLMNHDLMTSYGALQAFKSLDAEVAQGGALYGLFNEDEIKSGTFVAEDTDGLEHVYGISAARLYGMLNQGVDTRSLYLCCTSYTENEPYAIKMMAWLAQETNQDPPAWLSEYGTAEETEEPANAGLPQIG